MKNFFTRIGLCGAFALLASCAHQSAELNDSRTVASAKKNHPTHAIYAALSCTESGKQPKQGLRANILLRPTSGVIKMNSDQRVSLKRNGDKKEKRTATNKVIPTEEKRFTATDVAVSAPFDIFRADGPVQLKAEINKKKMILNCIAMDRFLERNFAAAQTGVRK